MESSRLPFSAILLFTCAQATGCYPAENHNLTLVHATPANPIEGQLNAAERQLLTDAIVQAAVKPKVAVEVGTWLGGGSTLHILRALHRNGIGTLLGIEADRSVYEQMVRNIREAVPEAVYRFTPAFGYSHDILPGWLERLGPEAQVDFVFLDGGNNPREQIEEFVLLESRIAVGGQIMAHDAKLRKGKWLVPYLSLLDNWTTVLHDVSEEGLLHARKTNMRATHRSLSAARRKLFQLHCSPLEIAARIVPKSVRTAVLHGVPRSVAGWIADGRR